MSITRRGIFAAAVVSASLAIGLTGCSSSGSLTGSNGSSASTGASAGSADAKTLVIGSTGSSESQLIGYIYGGALAEKGYTVSYKTGIGERSALISSLKTGSLSLVPEYAGSLLNFLDTSATAKSSSAVKSALDTQLATAGLVAYDFAPAADADSVTVTKAYASKHNLSSISDLKGVGNITMAANANFATRPDGLKALKSLYGLSNISIKAINDYAGPTTLKALVDGTVQAADIYTSSPYISQNNLVVLSDPKNLFASQQIVPVISKAKASSTAETQLNAVSAKLTTADLITMNEKMTGSSKTDPQAVAKTWLADNGF